MRRWRAGVIAGAALALPWAASAQERQGTVDAGVASVRPQGRAATPATLASGRVRLADRRWLLGADGAATLADGARALQGIAQGSVAPWAPLRLDAAASLARVDVPRDGTGRTLGATGRIHVGPGWPVGGWVQGERSTTSRESMQARASAIGGALTGRAGPLGWSLGAQRGWSTDRVLLEPVGLPWRAPAALRYDDWTAGVSLLRGRVEAGADLRRRTGLSASRIGGGVRAALRVTELAWVEAQVARQLADPLRGAPEVQIAMLLVRLQSRRPSPAVTWRLVPGGAEVTVVVPGEASAELAGSWDDWAPRPMVRRGGGWTLTVRLPSGTHRLAVRRGGGEWTSPPGLPASRDEFGGASGLLVSP